MSRESSSKSQSSKDRGTSSYSEERLKLSNVQSSIELEVNAIVSSLMSCAEIVTLLARHSCQDLTRLLSSDSISQYPVSTGGFGDIYRGKLPGNQKVAIKTARVFESCELGKYHKSVARELYTWSKCRHPNVVELMGLVEFRGSLAMVSVWAEHGTLPIYLKKNPSTDRCSISTLICRGLAYLHDNSIIHGDLKGDNVLISADGNPMLNDFGNASVQNASLRFSQTTTGVKYSTRWAAPEIMMETTLLTREADVYSLGMTILETFSGDVPYASIRKDLAVMHHVIYKKELPPRPIDILTSNSIAGNRIWDILTTCWSHNPEDRPSAMGVQRLMESIESHMFLPLQPSADDRYNHTLDPSAMDNYPSIPSHSLFCQCNETHCVCWPSGTFSQNPISSQSQPQFQSRPHQPTQPPLTTSAGPQSLPARGLQLPALNNPPSASSYRSPNAATSRFQMPPAPPQVTIPLTEFRIFQLHPLLRARSIMRTPEMSPALRLLWDVRDSHMAAIIHSQYRPEYLEEHSASKEHATSPPVPFLLVGCNDALPWLAPVHAREGSAGVTVRDVLEAISEVTHTQVEESMAHLLRTDEDRTRLYKAYHNRVNRNGGAGKKGILAVDWLGEKTLFVCLERDEALARKRVKEEHMWPYVFCLKLRMREGPL